MEKDKKRIERERIEREQLARNKKILREVISRLISVVSTESHLDIILFNSKIRVLTLGFWLAVS
jgi:hypothetical protein